MGTGLKIIDKDLSGQYSETAEKPYQVFRDPFRFDLEYIRRRSALHDLTIMARTIPVMAFPIRPARGGASDLNISVPPTGMGCPREMAKTEEEACFGH